MTGATPATRRGCRPPVRIPFNGHGITPYGMVSALPPVDAVCEQCAQEASAASRAGGS